MKSLVPKYHPDVMNAFAHPMNFDRFLFLIKDEGYIIPNPKIAYQDFLAFCKRQVLEQAYFCDLLDTGESDDTKLEKSY